MYFNMNRVARIYIVVVSFLKFPHTRVPTVSNMSMKRKVNTAPAGMLISLKIAGLMARIYDIVRNVVMPAIISVRTVVLLGSKPNSFLSIV